MYSDLSENIRNFRPNADTPISVLKNMKKELIKMKKIMELREPAGVPVINHLIKRVNEALRKKRSRSSKHKRSRSHRRRK